MEAVAAISSIAGILSLAGQALNGIVILRGFFKDCASASVSIRRFMKKLNDLVQCLEAVRELMVKLEESSSTAVTDNILASLQIQIDDCNRDIYRWLDEAKGLMIPSSSTGTKAISKKFVAALEEQKAKDIYSEISVHKENINTNFTLIGR